MTDIQLVEEVPGLYGALRVEEKVVQKIWADQDFDKRELVTECGKKVIISSPGIWNLAEEGPDFKNASISLDNSPVDGDIEIHFNSSDWEKHGHHKDVNYNRVLLHVTFFPQNEKKVVCKTQVGKEIPQLVLLPKLRHSLEEHLEKQALERLSAYESKKTSSFSSLIDHEQVRQKNYLLAKARWVQKKKFAQTRLLKNNQEEVFHETFLEVLGYRRNREPMARISKVYPTHHWRSEKLDSAKIFQSEKDWKLQGLRPANHPQKRLAQYCNLWKANPDWIEDALKMSIPTSTNFEKSNRKNLGLKKLKRVWQEEVLAGGWGGTRVDTLWIDACLPLLSEINQRDYFATWFHWFAGDFPKFLKEITKCAEIAGHTPNKPFSNGVLQGVLGYCIEERILG